MWNQVKLYSVRTLLEITHLASWKSYLVIIFPNSHEKLTKIEIRSSWIQFEHSSDSLIYPIWSHICSLFASIHMRSWPKVKLGKVIICPHVGLSTLIGPTIYHFNPFYMSEKFKDIEVNRVYYITVFIINFSHNMLHLWKTASWKLNDLDLTYQCHPRSIV